MIVWLWLVLGGALLIGGALVALILLRGASCRRPKRAVRFTSFFDPALKLGFLYPTGWGVEEFKDVNGILLLCAEIEAEWQASMFFELKQAKAGEPLDAAMDRHVARLREQKSGFELARKETAPHARGGQRAQVQYAYTAEATRVVGLDALFPGSADKLLLVTASSEKSLADKYVPVFRQVLRSVEIH